MLHIRRFTGDAISGADPKLQVLCGIQCRLVEDRRRVCIDDLDFTHAACVSHGELHLHPALQILAQGLRG